MPALNTANHQSHHAVQAECPRRWQHRIGLRCASRPVFEGAWNCGEDCLRRRIAEAVRRESSAGLSGVRQFRHRVPLGLLLLQAGVVNKDELQEALQAQRQAGRGLLGEWLQKILGVHETTITKALAKQWSCALVEFDRSAPMDQRLALWAPRDLLWSAGAIPAGPNEHGRLRLAFVESVDTSLMVAIERMSGEHVERGIMTPGDYRQAAECHVELEPVACISETVETTVELIELLGRRAVDAQPVASRLVRVHDFYWMRMWLDEKTLNQGVAHLPASPEGLQDVLVRMAPNFN